MERMWVLVVKRSLEMRSFILLNDAVRLCWILLARATVLAPLESDQLRSPSILTRVNKRTKN